MSESSRLTSPLMEPIRLSSCLMRWLRAESSPSDLFFCARRPVVIPVASKIKMHRKAVRLPTVAHLPDALTAFISLWDIERKSQFLISHFCFIVFECNAIIYNACARLIQDADHSHIGKYLVTQRLKVGINNFNGIVGCVFSQLHPLELLVCTVDIVFDRHGAFLLVELVVINIFYNTVSFGARDHQVAKHGRLKGSIVNFEIKSFRKLRVIKHVIFFV